MSDAPRDPAQELRALYRRLEPAPLADGVDQLDPESALVVRWMQRAWSELEPPQAVLPPSTLARRRAPRLPRRLLLAAAAALLLAGAAALVRSSLERRALPGAPSVAQTPAAAEGIEILSLRPDQVELRSGPVRLVLLGPPPPESSSGQTGS